MKLIIETDFKLLLKHIKMERIYTQKNNNKKIKS